MSDNDSNKELIRLKLIQQIKIYRNLATKLGVLVGVMTFVFRFVMDSVYLDPMNFPMEKLFFDNLLYASGFALAAYCIGAVIGNYMQRKHFKALKAIKAKRKQVLEDQMMVRQARLEAMGGL